MTATLTDQDIEAQFKAANEFFAPIALPLGSELANTPGAQDPLPMGKSGMPVQIVTPFYSSASAFTAESVSDDLKNLLDEQLDNLKMLGMVGTAMAEAKCKEKNDWDLMWNPDVWKNIISNYPLKIFRSSDNPTFHKTAKTIQLTESIVKEVLDVTKSAFTGQGMQKFMKFLEGLIANLKAGVEQVKESYATSSIDYLCEPDPDRPNDRVLPRIQANFVSFSKNTKTTKVACDTETEYTVDFKYSRVTYEFNYRVMSNPTFKKQFDDFITGHNKLDPSSSPRFFDGKKAQN